VLPQAPQRHERELPGPRDLAASASHLMASNHFQSARLLESLGRFARVLEQSFSLPLGNSLDKFCSVPAGARLIRGRIACNHQRARHAPWPRVMASSIIQPLNGFRDVFPEEFARRDYLFSTWRRVARRFGFVEYDGPTLESLELYRKKSGGELLGQLFNFVDKGNREVSLRPEMTPTLARMVAARAGQYKKPLKWFSIAPFFRFERTQRGRLREFYQFNADIFGESGIGADIELIALSIEVAREFGFTHEEVKVRLSTRDLWARFLEQNDGSPDRLDALLPIIDKFNFEQPDKTPVPLLEQLAALEIETDAILGFVENPDLTGTSLETIQTQLQAAGYGDSIVIDPQIVRGLAYYTGTVFELFDAGATMRALAGGGRYDNLVALLSDGQVDLPAIGLAFGDVVLSNLIESIPAANEQMTRSIAAEAVVDLFVVIADEANRPLALDLLTRLRRAGLRAACPLGSMKVGKQFQAADEQGARFAVVIGAEWPTVKVKTLADRTETSVEQSTLIPYLQGLGLELPTLPSQS